MPYVKRNFLADREPTAIDRANEQVRCWVEEVAGKRCHGTTRRQPLPCFLEVEQQALQPLPEQPYDLASWKQAKLHRDCYVVFEGAYYSAPYRLVGQQLWLRGGIREVHIYKADYELVAIHSRAKRAGERLTELTHLPPEKLPGLMLSRSNCREQARAIGPATAAVVEQLLAHRPEDRLRSAGRVLRLGQSFSAKRLERACARALHFSDTAYPTIKRILEEGLDNQPLPEPMTMAPACSFVRSVSELAQAILGGRSWN